MMTTTSMRMTTPGPSTRWRRKKSSPRLAAAVPAEAERARLAVVAGPLGAVRVALLARVAVQAGAQDLGRRAAQAVAVDLDRVAAPAVAVDLDRVAAPAEEEDLGRVAAPAAAAHRAPGRAAEEAEVVAAERLAEARPPGDP